MIETAIKVGSRHRKPVVYMVDTERMSNDGYMFYLSVNGVWLTKAVPTDLYIKLLFSIICHICSLSCKIPLILLDEPEIGLHEAKIE